MHESGHSLLFGVNAGAPLVENDARERYPSPLREDPRPMDGIVHASYVLARMYYALSHLEASSLLEPDERAEAQRLMSFAGEAYIDGLAVVDAHARFTDVGAQVFAGARQAMNF